MSYEDVLAGDLFPAFRTLCGSYRGASRASVDIFGRPWCELYFLSAMDDDLFDVVGRLGRRRQRDLYLLMRDCLVSPVDCFFLPDVVQYNLVLVVTSLRTLVCDDLMLMILPFLSYRDLDLGASRRTEWSFSYLQIVLCGSDVLSREVRLSLLRFILRRG